MAILLIAPLLWSCTLKFYKFNADTFSYLSHCQWLSNSLDCLEKSLSAKPTACAIINSSIFRVYAYSSSYLPLQNGPNMFPYRYLSSAYIGEVFQLLAFDGKAFDDVMSLSRFL